MLIALLFLDLVTQNTIYIQDQNNMDLCLFRIFCFTKFNSLRNNSPQVTDIQK